MNFRKLIRQLAVFFAFVPAGYSGWKYFGLLSEITHLALRHKLGIPIVTGFFSIDFL